MLKRSLASATVAVLLASMAASQAPAGARLSATPPMGWNSWNKFAGKVTDADIRATADILVSSGLRDAGYVYVNIDDTWEGTRDSQGNIQPNSKFPDMKALADYVHSKGLKLGIYSSPGPLTCAKFEGSYNHEEQDAKTYAAWGVDYLKYDLCGFRTIMQQQGGDDLNKQFALERAAYEKMHQAILATGRPMIYSLCQYGQFNVWEWGAQVGGNLWRTTGDINPTYDRMLLIGFEQAGLAKYAGPGHWNDPDMLEVGNGMSLDQSRVHMSLWAMLAAPLLAGNDLSAMTPDTLSVLSNREVIAVDQDALGMQGERLSAEGPLEIWVKPLSHGAKAVALFNRGSGVAKMKLPLRQMGWSTAQARDVWTQKDLGTVHDGDEMQVRGVTMLVVKPK